MSLFEYLAAGYTLILSFAVVRALAAFPHVLLPPSRYWVHTIWVCLGLALCVVAFWAFFSYRDVEWTLVRFVGVLEVPALIYVFNSILVPSEASSIESWRDHFYRVRRSLFATGVVIMVSVTISNGLTLGTFYDLIILLDAILCGFFAAGLLSASPRLHAGLAVAMAAFVVASTASVIGSPDAVYPR